MVTGHLLYADAHAACDVPLSAALDPPPGASVWLDIEAPDRQDIALLLEEFRFHPLAVEDVQHHQKRAKFERFPTHEFVVLTALDRTTRDDLYDVVPIGVFLRPGLVVTVRPKRITCIERVRDELGRDPSRVGNTNERVLHAMVDALVDELGPLVDDLGDRLDQLEARTSLDASRGLFEDLLLLRWHLLQLRRLILPHVEVLRRLLDRPEHELGGEPRAYFRDVLDHLLVVGDEVQVLLEVANGALSAHANTLNERTNETMMVLAIVSTLALPFTVLSGIFGMNFDVIPAAHAPWGFLGAVSVMVLSALVLLAYFRRRRWFRFRTLMPPTDPPPR